MPMNWTVNFIQGKRTHLRCPQCDAGNVDAYYGFVDGHDIYLAAIGEYPVDIDREETV